MFLFFCFSAVLTVDERTVPIRNRLCPIRIYNPSKPYKFGIEIFTICDAITYYCYDFVVYDRVKRKGLRTGVVLDMVETLPKDKKYDLVLDRGFTSPILLKKLLDMGHTATGTCMRNKKYFPVKLLKLSNKASQGTYKAAVCEKNKMVAVEWMDRKPVPFLSTAKGTSFYFLFLFLLWF